MGLTERDVEILRFINEFGFCEILQLERKFGFKKPRSYKVMERLVRGGLVIHERVFHNRHGIYYLSRNGARYTDLPPLMNIPVAIYKHQLTIIDIYFKLMQQYPEAVWICERRLKQEKFMKGIGQRGHIADGMLIFPDLKKVAIEVELTLKGRGRLKSIISGYITDFSINEVWYYCSAQTKMTMSELAKGKEFIKVNSLEYFFSY